MLGRDLREAAARPVRGNFGQELPAFAGTADHLEFTRLGFANPQAEPRSNLERVLYELDAGSLKRGRFAVLDRAPTTAPIVADLKVTAEDFRLRYLDRTIAGWMRRPRAADVAAPAAPCSGTARRGNGESRHSRTGFGVAQTAAGASRRVRKIPIRPVPGATQ